MGGTRLQPLRLDGERIYILDQNRLPGQRKEVELNRGSQARKAIRQGKVRGAPLVGIIAAFAMHLASKQRDGMAFADYEEKMERFARRLLRARPDIANLSHSVEVQRGVIRDNAMEPPERITGLLFERAEQMLEQDIRHCRKIARLGSVLLPKGARIVTFCSTGSLATGGAGTALSVLTTAYEKGRLGRVWVCESRPGLEGSALAALELSRADIPHTLITDCAAGALMREDRVDGVVVGANLVAGNGDLVNHTGTYTLAVLADHHQIPFYVAAPSTSFDRELESGGDLDPEQLPASQITKFGRTRLAPRETEARNPAFDVTPAELIDGIITETGMWERERVARSQR